MNSSYNLWDINHFLKKSDSSLLLDFQNYLYSESREIVSKHIETIEDKSQPHYFKAHKLACYLSFLRVTLLINL